MGKQEILNSLDHILTKLQEQKDPMSIKMLSEAASNISCVYVAIIK